MEQSVIVYLKKHAKKMGGDRYESNAGYVIYIPQFISRQALTEGDSREPVKAIEITFKSAE